MFEDYKLAVLDFYRLKKERHELSSNLEEPGREKLRNESIDVFRRKNTQVDKDLIRSFFDPSNKYEDQFRSIEKYKLDKLRPLVDFLKGESNIRDEKAVKLLAWLIDFESYKDWKEKELKVDDQEEAKEVKVGEENQTDSSQKPPVVVVVLGQEDAAANEVDVLIDQGGKPEEETIEPASGDTNASIRKFVSIDVKSSISIKWILVGSIVVLLIGGAASLLWESILDRPTPTPDKCMYWAGEYYKGIACDKNNNISTPVVQMDRNKLMHLTKITVPDTLTKKAIGKVWYSNIKGHHEFFSDSGMHPVDTAKRLRPLTAYILFKYTSYHRYQLTRLVWGISIISVIVLLVVLIRKEVKKKSLTAA